MIGNDIVDLQAAATECRITRKGFLDKLFLPAEKKLVQDAGNPVLITWLLWSCKEAVYKIVNRQTGDRRYAPHHYTVQIEGMNDEDAWGSVVHANMAYPFRTCFTSQAVHTYAASSIALLKQLTVLAGCFQTPSFTALLQQTGRLPLLGKLYKDTSGIPWIRNPHTGEMSPISLSHHGNYTGILLPPGF